MSARVAIACVCVLVGLGAIVGVSATAGPPDGYAVFHDRDVRVDLPTDFRTVRQDQGDIIVEVAGPARDRVEVAEVPVRGRTLAAYERLALENVRNAAPGVTSLRREDADVPGADEARRIAFHDPDRDRDRDVTIVIARDGARFVTLSIDVHSGSSAVDEPTVEDSFTITS
jgi:hypothetical protein